MSADNWTLCPQCGVNLQKELAKNDAELLKKYGKVSAEEYEALALDRTNTKMRLTARYRDNATLREDFFIGIREGEFEVDYSAGCGTCGYRFTFKEKRKVP